MRNEFKAFGMILLGVLGRNFALRGRALPLLWRGLMDYESAWVRAKAIDAAVEMFSSSSSSPPENMVDIILVHLRDPKVVVHQAAWRAVSVGGQVGLIRNRRMRPFFTSEGIFIRTMMKSIISKTFATPS